MSPRNIPVTIHVGSVTFTAAPEPTYVPARETEHSPVRHTRMVIEQGARQAPVRPMMYGNDVYFAPRGHTTFNAGTGLYEAPEGQRLNPVAVFFNWLFGSDTSA